MNCRLTENDLADYIDKQRNEWRNYAFAPGAGSVVAAKLDFQLGQVAPIYRVTFGDRQIYIGTLKETAVREYNALL